MIDPITAITVATTAFSTVKKFVNAGQEFEQVAGQLGKWYGAAADFRHMQQSQKKPPIFKKLFAAGSVEEEALSLLIHEKTLMEQEKQLADLLNNRFGYGTMKELTEMRRQIKKDREETIYKQMERQKAFVDTVTVIFLSSLLIGMVGFLIYFMGLGAGWW
jgi:hypothetical protein